MIVWLASYPKSGNTYLRSLLVSYFFSKNGNFDFKLLKNIKQFPTNDFFTSLDIDTKDKYQVAKNYIKAQEEINKKGNLIFLKTHSSFCKMYDRFNFSDLKNSLGVIYIVRDPRNVVNSFAHHNSKSIEATSEVLINDLTIGNEKNELEVYLGSWNFNYNSWKVYKSSKKYFLIKYEDLVSNPKKIFINTLKFIHQISNSKTIIDEIKIEKILEETNFSKMRSLEKKYGFDEAKTNESGERVKFFNLGPQNNWKKILDPQIRKKIETSFKIEMKELGYI